MIVVLVMVMLTLMVMVVYGDQIFLEATTNLSKAQH